jgi:phosphatidylglycerophosphatase A
MKNNLLKYYTAAFYFCFTVVMFAQTPQAEDTTGTLEETTTDTTPMPIDDYVWVLLLLSLLFVFFKFKSIQNKEVNN